MVDTNTRQKAKAAIRRQERSVAEAFTRFLREAKDPRLISQVEGYLARGRIGEALTIVDQQIVRFGDVMNRVLVEAAMKETDQLARQLRNTNIGITFNPADEKFVQRMRDNKLRTVRQMTATQRETTRNALVTAMRDGQGPRQVARAIKDTIGLTDNQRAAVRSYQDALERGSRDALSRGLRDRRFDSTISSAIEDDEPLSADQIERMVGRYTENMQRMRAQTIARTEGHRIAMEAQEEAFEQVVTQAEIPDDEIEREWIATDDERTRDTHAEMDGQVVIGMNTPFVSPSGARLMYPGDPDAPPEETINCRCSVLRRIKGGPLPEEDEGE